MADQILKLPVLKCITIEFHIYAKDKRKFDIGNIGSIHEKFFCDALTELGRLEDDNYLFLTKTTYSFNGIDKENPRVEILIKETSDD